METEGPVVLTRCERVATVTLNRPSTHNAINSQMWEEIASVFTELANDGESRVVILRARDRDPFSSGADLHELLQVVLRDRAEQSDRAAKEYWRVVNYANSAIEVCPKPVIAMVSRYALGAGCALAIACDLRIGATNTRMGVPAPQRGLTLGLNDTRRLVARVGVSHAAEILIEGGIYQAEEARRLGLLNKVVRPQDLEAETQALAAKLAVENAPRAMREAKANILAVLRNPSFAGIDESSWPIAWAGSTDLEEGIQAFLQGRSPNFTGQ